MAAAVVTVIIKDLLQSLGKRMKIGQQWGVKNELIQIENLLSYVVGVLPTAEMYGRSLDLQEWVRNLKEAAFDAEDLLEKLSVEKPFWKRKRKMRRFFPFLRVVFGGRMRDKLKDVARRMQELIAPDWISFIRNIPAGITEVHEAERAVPLIGRYYEKRELMRLLLLGGMEGDLLVLSVYGDLGIGKTALVREVLSESEVSRYYDVIIWVNASPPFDENRMARDIIDSLTNGVAPEEENVVKEQLLLCLWKLLDVKKKYLFILDDLSIGVLETWRGLRFCSFLKGGATGSKILVTTRRRQRISSKKSVLFLEGLTQEDSRDLLFKTAFKGGVRKIIDPATLKIIEEMAAECHGNPLIIRALGGYLSLQLDTSDWSSFRDKLSARREDLFSTLLYGGHPYDHLGPVVKSYNNLPPRIKQCFGLCSLFPRGHAIDRQTLAELWIALGYIKPSNEDYGSLEDIAYNYFNRLLKEVLFQVTKLDTFGEVRSVVLHPNAEDLARSVAGWECVTLRRSESLFVEIARNPRHMSVLIDQNLHPSFYSFEGLQTLLYFVDDRHKTNVSPIPSLRSERARVLDLQNMNEEAVPKDVFKHKHLRYLDLSDNRRIKTLPPEITGLMNLQTLKLSGCWELRELPQDMRKMVALRHLYIDGCRKLSLMPKGFGDLKFLNILTDFILPQDDSSSVDSANLADLCKLNDLRGRLRITNLGYSEATRKRFKIQGLLDKKSSLEFLELIFRNLPTDRSLLDKLRPHPNLKGLRIHHYGGVVLPEWMNRASTHLPNLVEVALIGCGNFDCDYFPQFDKLRHLKSLSIQGLPDLERMESGSGQTLSIVGDNTQPFGKLSSLCIRDCPKLEHLPRIPHLSKLTLVNVSEQLFGHPFSVASSLKTLRLENIKLLPHLSKEWLREPTSLEELHIRSCPKLTCLSMMMPRLMKLTLANVSEELFKQSCSLPSLKTLRLENIELLHHLSEHWLQEPTSLKELHIGSCPKLTCLSMTMPHLIKLTLANVGEELFKQPCDLPSLKTLRLENIEFLDHLPEHWLQDLTSLKELHIGSCPSLVSLSRGMMRLENLESLSIWNCKNLDLSKDEQDNVMRELHGLKSLKFLTIYKTLKMKYLPEWLSRVYTLRFLVISSCPNLVALPEGIGNLPLLKLIELAHCPRLTSLPAGMHKFTNYYPRKLSIIGCSRLKAEGIVHSCNL